MPPVATGHFVKGTPSACDERLCNRGVRGALPPKTATHVVTERPNRFGWEACPSKWLPVGNSKGATMVEFAMTLPILLLILFGIIEGAIVLYDKAVLTNASREGARAGIVSPSGAPLTRVTDADIRQIVKDYGGNYLIRFGSANQIQDSDIQISPSESARNSGGFGTDLTVNVTYHYDFLVLPGFITSLVGGIHLRAVTVMRLE